MPFYRPCPWALTWTITCKHTVTFIHVACELTKKHVILIRLVVHRHVLHASMMDPSHYRPT